MPPGTAVIPVAIGGASLTCSRQGDEDLSCKPQLPDDKTFAPAAAYYASEVERRWMKTSFAVAKDSYSVKIPGALLRTKLHIAVMLVDAENRSVGDYKMGSSHTFVNLLQDSSFEDKVILASDVSNSRLIKPAEQKAWLGANISSNTNCEANLELASTLTDKVRLPYAGNQWMELASRCKSSTPEDQRTLRAYQNVDLKVGHTYYVSFAFRMSGTDFNTQRLVVDFDNLNQSTIVASNESWVRLSFVHEATNAKTALGFTDDSLIQWGTAIDDIYLIDLTEAEAAL